MLESNIKFLESLIEGAQATHKKYGVPASVSIAQAILESGWGKKAPGNNLFGIKDDKSWQGECIDVPTHEYINGKKVAVTCKFRAYPSFSESIEDHGKFLAENKRYHEAFECNTGAGFAKAIAKAGYATDTSYANLLCSLIAQNNLQKYD